MFISKAERILELHANGHSIREIVKLAPATERYVRGIINGIYNPNGHPVPATPDPTPEEIAAGCAKTQAEWTRFQRHMRDGYRSRPVEIQITSPWEAPDDE